MQLLYHKYKSIATKTFGRAAYIPIAKARGVTPHPIKMAPSGRTKCNSLSRLSNSGKTIAAAKGDGLSFYD
jgi:hypothetical protein